MIPTNSSKRILLIAYNYPPLISPQSIRWLYLTRGLVRLGHRVDVLTISMPGHFKDLMDMIPKDSRIYRTFPGLFYYITYKYSRERSRGDNRQPEGPKKSDDDLIFRIYMLVHGILNRLFVPDIYAEWLPQALIKGYCIMRSRPYDVLISSSEQRICHLVAYGLKRLFPVRWIADYGDPWIYPVATNRESKLKRKIIKLTESHILRHMDFITLAAEGIKRLYLKDYSFLKDDKMEVVTQGYDPEAFELLPYDPKGDEFVLTYCGSFYKDLRDPSNLLSALRELDIKEMRVKIAGRINEFERPLRESPLAKIVEYKGFVDPMSSIGLQKNATILIFISNATDTQIPGKIYEYLGAKRPILCITGNERDLSARLIKDANRGIVVKDRKEDIKYGISELYRLWKEGVLESSFNLRDLEGFTWLHSAKKISEVIDKL